RMVLEASLTNNGEMTITSALVELIVNGVSVEERLYNVSIPYTGQGQIDILIPDILEEEDNVITINLLAINGEQDFTTSNNTATLTVDTPPVGGSGFITLIINTDDYAYETSWEIYNENTNEIIASGDVSSVGNDAMFVEEICVVYDDCLALRVLDSFGDGICCGYGEGNFLLLNAVGDTIVSNDGVFDDVAEEPFCPDQQCTFAVETIITSASNETTADGSLTVNASFGTPPYSYSIDGGETFSTTNTFSDLSGTLYDLRVMDANEDCIHQEMVDISADIINSVDDVLARAIKVFPNPVNDHLVIEMGSDLRMNDDVQIEIYDTLGKLLLKSNISATGNPTRMVLPFDGYVPGSYFVKCYNMDFERYFKVIKM
ncbi:MAG: T9SS type A sorting domain-containing protein, partial [Bacteroidota bacterium]